MSTLSSATSSTNVPLSTANYSLWQPAMEDYLQAKGIWYWIFADTPNWTTEPKDWRKCAEARDQAVGEIRRHLAPELRSISLGSSDPKSILDAIKEAYGKSSFATRFNALQAFLAVKQESSELIAAFISQARERGSALFAVHSPSCCSSGCCYQV